MELVNLIGLLFVCEGLRFIICVWRFKLYFNLPSLSHIVENPTTPVKVKPSFYRTTICGCG